MHAESGNELRPGAAAALAPTMARLYAAARSGRPRATPQPPEGVAREQSSRDRALGAPCASRGDPARHTASAPRPCSGAARHRILRTVTL